MHTSFQIEWLEQRWLLADVRFAVIGDYGVAGQPLADVSAMIDLFDPDFVTTTGDNNYEVGGANTIDPNIGQYFHEYIFNYQGGYGAGSLTRRFFPSLGNHDWGNTVPTPHNAQPYLNYFDLPTSPSGGERYYDFVSGPVHMFVLDSDENEPSGISETSTQANWLRDRLAASTAPHRVVVFHHAPYSSGEHGNDPTLQWPFSQWGATAVIAGHDHHYERLFAEGIPYFVNGIGGRSLRTMPNIVPESQFRYNANYGAMIVDANDEQMTFKLYTRTGALIDTSTLVLANQLPIVSVQPTDASGAEAGTNPAVFTISRTGSTAAPLTVNFALGGSAVMGADYQNVPLSITIPIGSSSAIVQLNPINDFLAEGAESVTLTLTSSALFNLGQDKASTATIADDDGTSALLFAGGGTWKYLDDGSNQGTAWRAIDFNAIWPSGGARFGYGDPGMVTTINGGPSNNRFITHYFRTTFNIANANAIDVAQLNVLRDDGAVIYLNGNEVWRTNMPAGTITSSTLASTGVGGADETTFFAHAFDPTLLQTGTNYLAVELHQSSVTTSDAVFDMYIAGGVDNVAPTVANQVFDFESWHELRFTFSENVFDSLDVSDLIITNLANPNDPLPSGAFALTAGGEPTVAVWRANSLLPDGLYRAVLPAGSAHDRANNALAGNVVL
ncbi:MAG: metallophosphoesterase, partial [Anaerolineae bacterium]|nr:metallophosphoesterase [Phycisphaerae bacterium]